MGIVTSVTTNYNPQLLFAAWTSVNSWRAAYFPNATSDVPANLLSPSGDVFTTPAGATGMGPAYSVYTGTECWKLFSCEQGIILRLAAPGITSSMYLVVGDMGEDYSENAIPLAGWMSNFTQALQVAPSSVSQGFATQIAGSTKLLQISLIPTLSYNTLTRNLATKESAYFPFILGNPVAGFNDIAGYKLRQFGRGPSPLAGNEILYSTGPVAESYATSEVTTDGFWVVNRKV